MKRVELTRLPSLTHFVVGLRGAADAVEIMSCSGISG
jgi:hypothetical protein